MKNLFSILICNLLILRTFAVNNSIPPETRLSEAGKGYAGTSVNTAVFRTDPIVSHGGFQYVSYYDPEGFVTLGKRKLGTDKWNLHKTQYSGNIRDGHNVISLGIDGNGILHVAFDHHGHPLHYAKGIAPGSLELGPLESMTGIDEDNVTYPEFHSLPDGDILFAYRSGASGRGNMALNRYDAKTEAWTRVQDSLINGEELRSPYWQMCVDANGVIHVSWVWRETWLVETNHDLCYARSEDGGKTWLKSNGENYALPITAANAEYAWLIPQDSELINQTSMTADSNSKPYIATYWRSPDSDIPQYRIVWYDGVEWKQRQISSRTTPFSLSGGGTKMIPIARPQIVAEGDKIGVVVRDEERGSAVSIYKTTSGPEGEWTLCDLTDFPVGAWEPSLDTGLFKNSGNLHIFVQPTFQGDGEVSLDKDPTPVCILETSL